MNKFTLTFIDENPVSLDKLLVNSVYLIGFKSGMILAGRNERGWDVPGGHLEKLEKPYGALVREAMEEVGTHVRSAEPFAILSSSKSPRVMLFFFTNDFELTNFTPKEDAFERDLLKIDEFLRRYYGDKILMSKIIDKAIELLR